MYDNEGVCNFQSGVIWVSSANSIMILYIRLQWVVLPSKIHHVW